jgi:hypothetical protein
MADRAGWLTSLSGRTLRAARLDASLHAEIEADRGALGQAMLVVGLSSLAAAVGAAGNTNVAVVLRFGLGNCVGWLLWIGLTGLIGNRLLPGQQARIGFGRLLRHAGFSAAPGLLCAPLGAVPLMIRLGVEAVIAVWMFASLVVVMRQMFGGHGAGRALAACLPGWLAYVAVSNGGSAAIVVLACLGRTL